MNEFSSIYLAGFVAGTVVRDVWKWRLRRAKTARRAESALDVALLVLAGIGFVLPIASIASPWLAFADYARPGWLGWAGAALFAAALWLLWRAHADLGRNWSPLLEIREGHTLVTEGAYRRIRHPMYAAHWLWAVAQVLLVDNWLAGPAFLVLFVPLYLFRVPREEQMMLGRFGEEYEAYMARTGRLLPI